MILGSRHTGESERGRKKSPQDDGILATTLGSQCHGAAWRCLENVLQDVGPDEIGKCDPSVPCRWSRMTLCVLTPSHFRVGVSRTNP